MTGGPEVPALMVNEFCHLCSDISIDGRVFVGLSSHTQEAPLAFTKLKRL